MLEEAGHEMSIYDPFYAPNASALRRRYDFVACTEALEHFHAPRKEWRLLLGLVKPGGWLALMTGLSPEQPGDFMRWSYKNDPTHVCFFAAETFVYLAQRDGLECEFVADNVVFLKKSREPSARDPFDQTIRT